MDHGGGTSGLEYYERGGPGQARLPGNPEPCAAERSTMLSVLIVDDDSAIRSVLIRSLERRGCTVASAANGLEGLNAIRRGSFDVVISDVNMPRRGGLWLREKALALRPELGGRVLLISAEPLPRSEERRGG